MSDPQTKADDDGASARENPGKGEAEAEAEAEPERESGPPREGEGIGYTVEDAASRLSLEPEQVRDILAAGALQTTGRGDKLRITHDSLLYYIASRMGAQLRAATERPSKAATASALTLPLLGGMWYLAACVEFFSVRDDNPLVPVPIALAGLAAILGLAWWLGRQAADFSTVNGIGTALYGRRMTPKGRIGTQWLVFAGIPLLPIRSYVLLEVSKSTKNWRGQQRARRHQLRELGGVYWPQALPVMLGVWAAVCALIAFTIRK